MDLFIGGGVKPGEYPLSSPSYFLINDSGKFIKEKQNRIDTTESIAMVNKALFSDIDNDNDQDLILVGEWMPVMVFENHRGAFKNKEIESLKDLSGWYFTIIPTDIDKDGDIDYLAGNIGGNTKFQPNKDKPLHINAKDYDQNGSLDEILRKASTTGLLLPVRGKQCSSEQVPMLNTKFKSYGAYANASLPDIYGDKNLKEATHYIATEFSTLLLINNGSGDFEVRKLPVQAQFGPTTDVVVDDFNNDGIMDIFGVGSINEAEVETIRYDANKGYFLFGNSGQPTDLDASLPALHQLQTIAAEQISIGDKKLLLVLSKNEGLKLLQLAL